jgi:hypothetical protein
MWCTNPNPDVGRVPPYESPSRLEVRRAIVRYLHHGPEYCTDKRRAELQPWVAVRARSRFPLPCPPLLLRRATAMVDWMSPATLAQEDGQSFAVMYIVVMQSCSYILLAVIFNNFMHAIIGLYAWKYFTSLGFEWELLTGRKKFQWPLVSRHTRPPRPEPQLTPETRSFTLPAGTPSSAR